jgi:hypothetical protein
LMDKISDLEIEVLEVDIKGNPIQW